MADLNFSTDPYLIQPATPDFNMGQFAASTPTSPTGGGINLDFGKGPVPGFADNLVADAGAPVAPNAWQSFKESLLGSTDPKTGLKTQGLGDIGLGVAKTGMNAWLGMQQLDLAKETFAFQKDAFNKNFQAQRQQTNRQLEDRQNARVASNPGAYQAVQDYMAKNRV